MSARRELRSGWPLVVACAVGFGLGLSSIPFYTYGVFVEPLRQAFGWTMAQAQSGLTASYLTTIVAIPVVGWLTDRFGARRVVLASLCLFGLSYMVFGALNGGTAQFLAIWVLITAAGAGTLSLTWSRALSGVFEQGRGLALSLGLVGSGVAGFLGPPLARYLVDEFGWRRAYVGLGALPLLIALPLALAFFREAPKRAHGAATAAAAGGLPLSQALRDRRFWLIGVAFLMIGIGVTGLVPNLVKILTITGMTVHQAVLTTSLVGLFVILGRLSSGALLDQFWGPAVALGFLMLPAVACILLNQGHVGLLSGALAAALIGLAMGAEFDLLPYLVGRYFGLAHFGAVMGVASALFYLGASAGAPAVGWVYDSQGGYGAGLIAIGALFTAAAVILLLLGPYPVYRPGRPADGLQDPISRVR